MFVVDTNAEVYVDRDDARYSGKQRTFDNEREALEYAVNLLRQQENELAKERRGLEQRLKQLPPRFAVGARVLVEGMEGLVVKLDPQAEFGLPYLVFITQTEQTDWYRDEEVKPCPSSE